MDKVYIVTTGSYSDYRIRKVFIDEEKAKKYMKTVGEEDAYNEPQIEEWDIENNVPQRFILFRSEMRIKQNNEISFYMSHGKCNTFDDHIEGLNGNHYWYRQGYIQICIFRSMNIQEITLDIEKKYERKYKKVLTDIHTEIKALKEIEGWTNEMVKEWFENKRSKNGQM